MENKTKSNKGLIGIIIILIIIIIALTAIVVMDKLNNNDKNNKATDNTNNITENNKKEEEVTDKKEESINIPNDLVGKYINKNEKDEYFILKADGTAELSFITGDGRNPVVTNKNAKFKILYSSDFDIIIEFYNDALPYSPVKIGRMLDDNITFADINSGPTNNEFDFVYQKQNN